MTPAPRLQTPFTEPGASPYQQAIQLARVLCIITMGSWLISRPAHAEGNALHGASAPPAQNTLCVPAPAEDITATAHLPHTGQVTQVFSCQDKEGHHLYFATTLAAVAQRPDLGAREMRFYQFTETRKRGTYRRRWEVRDSSHTGSATLKLHRFETLDRDGDGLAEAYMAYSLLQPSSAIEEGKLIIYHQGRKATMRGTISRHADEYASRTHDALFLNLPQDVQDQALSIWDSLSPPVITGQP